MINYKTNFKTAQCTTHNYITYMHIKAYTQILIIQLDFAVPQESGVLMNELFFQNRKPIDTQSNIHPHSPNLPDLQPVSTKPVF